MRRKYLIFFNLTRVQQRRAQLLPSEFPFLTVSHNLMRFSEVSIFTVLASLISEMVRASLDRIGRVSEWFEREEIYT